MPNLTLDLRHLRYAIVAAESGSFRKAAASLGISQSTLSRRVQLLEHRLGFSVFVRDRKGIRLTVAGANFLESAAPNAYQIERSAVEAAAVSRGERGKLRVGFFACASSGRMQDVLARFGEQHPNVRVILQEGTWLDALNDPMIDQADVWFAVGDTAPAGYRIKTLWLESIYVALPNGHRLAGRTAIDWEAISTEQFIAGGASGFHMQNRLISRFSQGGPTPSIEVHEVSCASLMKLVAMNYGIALTSTSYLLDHIEGVVYSPIANASDILPLSIVWRENTSNPAVSSLVATAEKFTRNTA